MTDQKTTHNDDRVAQIANEMFGILGHNRWAFCLENDCYAVSDDGRIFRTCRRQLTKTGNVSEKYGVMPALKGSLDKDGYRVYRMTVDGKKRHMKGHRLAANALLGRRDGLQINHKDGVKSNNELSNLEWVTSAENQKHAIDNGLKTPYKLNTKNQKVPFYDWTTIYALVKHFGVSRQVLAKRNGVCRQTIDVIVRKVENVMDQANA